MPLKSLRRLMTNGGGCKCGIMRGWKVKVKAESGQQTVRRWVSQWWAELVTGIDRMI